MHHRYLKNLTLLGLFLVCLTSKVHAHSKNTIPNHPVANQKQESDMSLMLRAGSLYESKKFKEAFPLYLQAADQGHAKAQYNLGEMYYYGEGIKQSYPEALKWYRKAADQGHAMAQEALKRLNR